MLATAGPTTPVRAIGRHLRGPMLLQGRGGLAQGAGGIDQVVDQHAAAIAHVADDVHDLGLVGRGRRLSMIARSASSSRFANARARTTPPTSGDTTIRRGYFWRQMSPEQDRRRVDVVDRDVEEALDLIGVQIHGQHAIGTRGTDHLRHQPGGDRHARGARTAVLPRIAEVGDDRGDALRRGPAQRVDHHQQLHQIVVGRRAGRLHHEHVAPRTFSWISVMTSPSLNWPTTALPKGMLRWAAISAASPGWRSR
jgi:hypothetical protein